MSNKTRQLPPQDLRVETGPLKFGDDWTGVFIRGDNALNYAINLESVISKLENCPEKLVLTDLLSLLKSSNENDS